MKAEIIATGTELLLGETLNTSTHYLTAKLSALGIEVDYHTTVGDNPTRLENCLRQALERVDLVVTSGGLGSTADDLTKELAAKVMKTELELDVKSLEALREFFTRRGSEVPDGSERQAYLPKEAIVLPNTVGTAPGAMIRKNGKIVVILPGPPSEMQPMFESHVLPELKLLVKPDVESMHIRVLKVFGLDEPTVERYLSDLMENTDPALTLLAKKTEMHIRLVARGGDTERAGKSLDLAESEIRSRLQEKVFGRDEETMVGIAANGLSKHGLTIATAESCTGGLLGAALTQEPGSSNFYVGGVVSYANFVKESFVGVKKTTLDSVGAVSAEVAKEMAAGIRAKVGTDLALATTGIAGPDGGSEGKPVGLVYIGLASADGVDAKRFQFYGGREAVRQLAVQAALDWLRQYMLNMERGTFQA